MAKIRLSSILSIVGFLIKNWQWITSTVLGGIVTWLATISPALRPYAPLSYAAVFVFGTLLVMATLALGAWFAERVAKRAWWIKAQEPNHSVNPLETTFSHLRVSLMDLADPETRVIRGKTFVDCEIIGRRLTFTYSGCIFDANPTTQWAACDFISMPVTENDMQGPMQGPGFANAYLVEHCVFRGCTFYHQTALFPEPNARHIASSSRGLNWVVPPRPTTTPAGR